MGRQNVPRTPTEKPSKGQRQESDSSSVESESSESSYSSKSQNKKSGKAISVDSGSDGSDDSVKPLTKKRKSPAKKLSKNEGFLVDVPAMQPYLGLWAIVSLSWVSYAFLPILSLLFSLLIVETQLTTAANETKSLITSTCSSVDDVASYVVSMPHYTAGHVNEELSRTIEGVLNLATNGLILLIDALKGVVKFLIGSLLAPFICLIKFALDAMILPIKEGLKLVEAAIAEIGKGVATATEGIIKVINDIVNGANKIPFVKIDKIPEPNLDALTTIKLDIVEKLTDATSKIPSAEDMISSMTSLLNQGFNDLQKTIKEGIGTISVRDTLPVPQKERVNVCGENTGRVVDQVETELRQVIGWMLIALGVAAVLLFIGLAIRAVVEYKIRLAYLEATRPDLFDQKETPTYSQLMMIQQGSSSPVSTLAMSTASEKRQWFFNYVFQTPVLAFLFIGLIGLFVIEGQILLLNTDLRQRAEESIAEVIRNLKSDLKEVVNSRTRSTSEEYANGSNTAIDGVETAWKYSFGFLMGNVTTFIQKNVVETYDKFTDMVTDIFGNGPYANNLQNLIYCIIGSKVNMLDEVITWLNKNANPTFPKVSDDVLTISDDQIDSAIIQTNATDNNAIAEDSAFRAAVNSFFERYEATLVNARWGYLFCLLVVLLVVISAAIGVTYGGNKVDAYQKTAQDSDSGSSEDEKPQKSKKKQE